MIRLILAFLAGALSAYLLLVYIALNSGGTVPEPGGGFGEPWR